MAKKLGRPTVYKPEYDRIAHGMALLGATDAEMADAFGVSEQTVNAWKKAHPTFLESLKSGKVSADANVASRLYQRALGYEHDDTDIRVCDGAIAMTPIRKYYPPDTTAAIFWLKNRQPSKWRDKTEIAADAESVANTLAALASKLPD